MAETHKPLQRIEPSTVRYIRLGEGGRHSSECLAEGRIGVRFAAIPHEVCCAGDWAEVRRLFVAEGLSPQKASDHTRELRDFYNLGDDTLWVTAANGRMWWAFASPEVNWLASGSPLPRLRRTMGPWRSTSLASKPLLLEELSTRLTSVRGFRGTICHVRAADYLLRKLNDEPEPIIQEAEAARASLRGLVIRLIHDLHERDFELLTDLIFANLGWRRVSILGRSLADLDLLLEQPALGERAFVQVKSRAIPATLDDYIARFRAYPGVRRMFFVCHSPTAGLKARLATKPSDVELWFAEEIAEMVIRAGLFDWLVQRFR